MLSFFRKNYELVAPVSGRVINLSDVPEAIFAEKLIGEGTAIEPSDNLVVSPASGYIKMIFKTNHGFAVSLESGIEVLVHIGLDTVSLQGEGFERLVEEGEEVRAGQPIIRMDMEKIKGKGCNLITPIIIVNSEKIKDIEYTSHENVICGVDNVLSLRVK